MLQLLEKRWPGAAGRLRADALIELGTWPDVQVRRVPDEMIGTRCSVAGGYVHDTTPPTLTVTESLSLRRRQFTALHELGHHLQKTDARLALAVRRQPADRETFEDAACDVFASLVLISDEMLQPRPGSRSPSASDVCSLFERTQASRAACSVRIAQQLGTDGVVAVLDSAGIVSFAAAHGEVYPPARGWSQAHTPLVRAALHRHANVQVDDTYVQYRSGSTSIRLYGDAAWSGDYLITVAVLDRPGWKPFAPPRTGPGGFVSRQEFCEVCEEQFLPTENCPKCRNSRCPAGHCACTHAADRQCERCFLTLHPNRFASPTARMCKECAE
ncbi:ImmA/IrrE family metallo-endopeptidase [Sphaerisporangium sp. B11E5]|uniref:ImmA/IrrE family metallo-endopeptidase n=1 Tax=Sphaerisporangium sp. B11E5 TaxID=3153563 RepID=UPI00325D99FB